VPPVRTGEHRPKGTIVSVIVIEFITLDGIVSDPDGSGGTPAGGWAFRHGPDTVAGDKFRLGRTLDDGVMLLGRKTWQLFSTLWPGRDDPFSARMNAVPKLVASRTLTGASAWANSRIIDGDVIDAVKRGDHHRQPERRARARRRGPDRRVPAAGLPHGPVRWRAALPRRPPAPRTWNASPPSWPAPPSWPGTGGRPGDHRSSLIGKYHSIDYLECITGYIAYCQVRRSPGVSADAICACASVTAETYFA
jgi:hypothetical protein